MNNDGDNVTLGTMVSLKDSVSFDESLDCASMVSRISSEMQPEEADASKDLRVQEDCRKQQLQQQQQQQQQQQK